MFWKTDKGFINSILINLLSNAFKYTPNGALIIVELVVCNDNLQIIITNEGNIKEKDIVNIFARYTILENFEKQDNKQNFSRTGLGLSITSNMIKLLKGTIKIENSADHCVSFTVTLPKIEIDENTRSSINVQRYIPSINVPLKIIHEKPFDKSKPTILIIDDDIEMLWFISELFIDHYNTIWLQDSTQILNQLDAIYPDLIICDMMMPELNGIDLIKTIKNKKETSHIPIIMVSAKLEIELPIEALSVGAEIYITKPFNTEFLKTSVNQLFDRKEKYKDYLSSPISSYALIDGKLALKVHRKFFQSVLTIINDNIMDPELSTKFIADKLGIGYRSLLLQTTLTIDEIGFKAGFLSKATFFRAFIKKFNCTPNEYRRKNRDELAKIQ